MSETKRRLVEAEKRILTLAQELGKNVHRLRRVCGKAGHVWCYSRPYINLFGREIGHEFYCRNCGQERKVTELTPELSAAIKNQFNLEIDNAHNS